MPSAPARAFLMAMLLFGPGIVNVEWPGDRRLDLTGGATPLRMLR